MCVESGPVAGFFGDGEVGVGESLHDELVGGDYDGAGRDGEFDGEACREWADASTWSGIDILGTDRGGEDDDEGYVEFMAHYASNGEKVEHHEHSYFKKIDGEWKFIDGKIENLDPYVREEPKIGRNDPCPCGSGKKYKKCCGKGK